MSQQRGEAALHDLIGELKAMDAMYTVERFLSSGSYGAVCAGTNSATQDPVAVKRVFTTVSDGKSVTILADTFLARRVIREVKMLCHFHHPNILGLLDLLVALHPTNPAKHKIYLVTELMKTDMAQVISDRRLQLTPDHVRYFMYHMLLGLRVLHQSGVIHRDLHPGNILLSEDNDLKICDFNLAREDKEGDEKTHYVTLRWYRAPELVMQHRGFGKGVDIWSAGCIFAELYNRKPLFRGSTFYNQLNKIVEVVGTPPEEDVAMFASESARVYLKSTLANVKQVPWAQVVPAADDVARDLIDKMLTFNPAKRITADQALRHPFFAEMFDPADLENDGELSQFHFDDTINDVSALHVVLNEEAKRFEEARKPLQNAGQRLPPVPRDGPGVDAAHMPRAGSFVSLADHH